MVALLFSTISFLSFLYSGATTGTVTTELALKYEKNETKSFALQNGEPGVNNHCIVQKWRDKENTIKFYVGEKYERYDLKFDTRLFFDAILWEAKPMKVNLKTKGDEIYIGSLNCGGAFPYRDSSNDECWYVPIINGDICNHETGERYSGKIDFLYRFKCPIVDSDVLHYQRHGCFFEFGVCY